LIEFWQQHPSTASNSSRKFDHCPERKIMKTSQSFVIKRLQKAQNARDLEAFLACFAPNFQGNHPLDLERGFQGIEDRYLFIVEDLDFQTFINEIQ
jgi:hypothetical protein